MPTDETLYGTDRVMADVLRERKRQVVAEGFGRCSDDQQPAGRLALAAAAYLVNWAALVRAIVESGADEHDAAEAVADFEPPDFWPMEPQWWKPHNDRHDLVRAAALIVAEIERMDRAADSHPRREQLTALDDQFDHDAHRVDIAGRRGVDIGDRLHVHLDPGHRLAAVGDRVLIEPAEVAQRFPADSSSSCAPGGLDSAPSVESSPVDSPPDSGSCGGGE